MVVSGGEPRPTGGRAGGWDRGGPGHGKGIVDAADARDDHRVAAGRQRLHRPGGAAAAAQDHPVYSDIIVTEELPEGLAERVFPTNRHGNDILRIRSRYRLTPECRRLLFGGRGRFGAASARQNARSLHALMVERLPDFRVVRVEDAWSGPGGMKAGGAPVPRTCPSASRSRGASPQTA